MNNIDTVEAPKISAKRQRRQYSHICSTLRLIIPCLILGWRPSQGATIKPDDENLSVILQTVDYVFADSFTQAHVTLSQMRDTIPGEPIYHMVFASILHARMMDSEDFSYEKEFMANINETIDALNDWKDRNPDDAWGYFFLGSAYGYKAIWQGQKGSLFKSMLSGLKSKANFANALKLDPHLYDCYTGIGSYHYWASVKMRKIFPFLSDNREEGLRELRLAMDSSFISVKAASVGYGWALLNEKKYSDAIKIANRLKDTTCNGRNSLWLLSSVYWSNTNLKKASECYSQLIESLERTGNQNYYNLIYCYYRRGICYYGLRNYSAAESDFNTLLSFKPSKEIRNRHKNIYQRTSEMLDKIKKSG